MKTLFTIAFLFWVGITHLQCQKVASNEQETLKAAFEQFKQNFDNTTPTWDLDVNYWYENDCPFYQLKWIKNTNDNSPKNYTIEKGDNSCLCEQGQKQHKFYEPNSGTFASVRKKYVVVIPMSKNAKEYYFEMDEEQEILKNQFIKNKQAREIAQKAKRQDSIENALRVEKAAQELQAKEQGIWKAEYNTYIAQLDKASGGLGNFKENPEFAKECHLYQLKWVYFCVPGGSTFIQKGNNEPLCNEPLLGALKSGIFTTISFSADGKYAISEHSTPMGTCDDRFSYYERIK